MSAVCLYVDAAVFWRLQ